MRRQWLSNPAFPGRPAGDRRVTDAGATLGGTTVTISGANFAAGPLVSVGGTPATSVILQSSTSLTAVTPAHVGGAADVVVTVNGQRGSLRGGFTYVLESVNNQPPKLVSLVTKAKYFLVLFSQSSISAVQVVHNFLDGCGAGGTGKQDELAQVTANRTNFLITAWKVGDPKVTINFDTTCAYRDRKEDSCTTVDVDWRSTCLVQNPDIGCPTVGATRHDIGVDWVTARYDAATKRWWLCDSDYEGQLSTSFKPYLIK